LYDYCRRIFGVKLKYLVCSWDKDCEHYAAVRYAEVL